MVVEFGSTLILIHLFILLIFIVMFSIDLNMIQKHILKIKKRQFLRNGV